MIKETQDAFEMRDAFFNPLVEAALIDPKIIILAADHSAFSLNRLINEVPNQFINVGISEQNMISVAAGMALVGKKVFAYGITPFVSLKVLEQFTLDVAALDLDVNIISVGAGFAYSTDGPSHHGLQDVSCMLGVPNIKIWNCSDPSNSKLLAHRALSDGGPSYIRIEKGLMQNLSKEINHDFGCSKVRSGNDLCIITSGSIVHDVIEAANTMEKESGIVASVVDVYQLKPLPSEGLCRLISSFSNIVTVEEGLLSSGFGNCIAGMMLQNGIFSRFMQIGVEDQFCYEYGSRELLKSRFKLDAASIAKRVSSWLK